MNDADWVLIDTETTGLTAPIIVVELAAQRMRGWEPQGAPFRRMLNQNADISSEASRVHGYTREILERDGEPAIDVYRDFAAYTDDLPIVSYNLKYDLDDVLKPEWSEAWRQADRRRRVLRAEARAKTARSRAGRKLQASDASSVLSPARARRAYGDGRC